ncbi:MAG: histone-like nucleoid-structuring protein Lsr2 [Nocardioidaceae bacterium]
MDQPSQQPAARGRRSASTRPRTRARVAATDVRKSRNGTGARSGAASNAEVRSWARQTGLTVSDRGRVPASVLTAYLVAHP